MEIPVLHVVVVGFHHKKGCQVEYSYPPLIEGNSVESHEIPEEWKHIPSLALPDGAHNYEKDTVFFVLPGRKNSPQTVYGVSCYRQMDAKDLINRTADVTRSTVQKSVCVLSKLPLFGLIKAKLELITHAYFDERDFSQVALLEQTYNNLNTSLTQSLLQGTQVFLGLSVRDLVMLYRHKIIVLFKLLLLERRVLFFGSPVERLSQTILSVVSLFPGMLENGLVQSCNQWSKKLSPTMCRTNLSSDLSESEEFLEIRYHSTTPEASHSQIRLSAGGDAKYTALNINEGEMETSSPQTPEAPESPTIPRDEPVDGTDNAPEASKIKSNAAILSKAQKDMPSSGGEGRYHYYSRSNSTTSNASSEGTRLSVHAPPPPSKSLKKTDTKTEADEEITYHEDESPLTRVGAITHIESIQDGAGSNDFANGFEKDSKSKARCGSASLTLHTTTQKAEGIEDIEDLDSPESINKIDMEDCFSWEEDGLKLTFNHVESQEESPRSEGPPQSMVTSQDSVAVSENGKESGSSETMSVSGSSLDTAGQLKGNVNSTHTDKGSPNAQQRRSKAIKDKLSAAFKSGSNDKVNVKVKKEETGPAAFKGMRSGEVILTQDHFGFPLAIFTKGCVCHPYLSLQYHDILTDVDVRSFVIGATNILFKQRRQLIDVVVEIGDGKLDIREKELQRQLNLTTADLRFAEYLVKVVTEERQGNFFDGTEWEGSDEWIRAQFKQYLNSLLATALSENQKLLENFGTGFVSAWKTTFNYRQWHEGGYTGFSDVSPGHPFQGNLNVTDVKMRFNHTLQSSEGGRRINAAVTQTGKYVAQTGKAVGGAFSSAKTAVSGWFSSWRTPDKIQEEEIDTQLKDEEEKDALSEQNVADHVCPASEES